MKTVRREMQELDLRQLLREAEGRIVLLSDDGEDRFAFVPGDEKMRPKNLSDAERRARGWLDADAGGPSAARELVPLDPERLTLRELLRRAEGDTAVFLAQHGEILFALLPLSPAGTAVTTDTPRRRDGRPQRPEPREEWRDGRRAERREYREPEREIRRRRERPAEVGLSSGEWVLYPLLFLFIPMVNVLVSSVLYYTWLSGSPRKAKQINLLGFAVFGAHVLLALPLVLLIVVLSEDPQQQGANPPPGGPFQPGILPPPNLAPAGAGPLAYWSFDEGQGERASNAGRAGDRFARLHGAKWTEGVRGKAVAFDGVSDYCDLGDSPGLNFTRLQVFLVSLWVKTDDDFGTVFLMRNKGDGGPVVTLVVENGQLVGLVREDGAEAQPGARSQGPRIADGQWHHVCLSRDAGGGQTRIIVDGEHLGVLAAQQLGGAGPITTDVRALGTERYWALRGQGTPERRSLRGSIDEVCIYDRTLNGAELRTLRDAGRPPGS